MQRVRIGLTGLACVFLLVVLAAAFLGLARSEDETTTATAGAVTANSVAEDAPRDPLAELGVAPGNAPADAPQQDNAGAAGREATR